MLSSYVSLNELLTTNLRKIQEEFGLKIWENVRTARLSLNFTGSYKKECVWLLQIGCEIQGKKSMTSAKFWSKQLITN